MWGDPKIITVAAQLTLYCYLNLELHFYFPMNKTKIGMHRLPENNLAPNTVGESEQTPTENGH